MRALDTIIMILFCAVAYCYLVYPYLIRLLARYFPSRTITDENMLPRVSIILAVYNEEIMIERCLESILALDYPKENIEILIGSDGSTDLTSVIAEKYCARYPFIRFYPFSERRGKMPVLNDLAVIASGEILFFADADITLSPNTLKTQLRHYADSSVGAVGGLYHIHAESGNGLYSSEKEYASLEQQIRISEGIFSSSMGVFGGNYTIRRELWNPLPDPLVHDDLYVALSVISQKKRVIYEPESHSVDFYDRSLEEEFRRKSRSASRGYHTISFFPKLLGVSGGKNMFLLWSHKILRWLSPFIFIVILFLSILGISLYGNSYYSAVVFAFGAAGLVTLLGWLFERMSIRVPLVRQFTWLVIMNIAYISGTLTYLMKTDEGAWKQATRQNLANPPYTVKEAIHTK